MPKFKLIIEDATAEELQNFLNSSVKAEILADNTSVSKEKQSEEEADHVKAWDQGVKNAAIGFPTEQTQAAVAPSLPTVNEQPQTPINEENNNEVDAEGLPWDERIHSSNQKKTAKNVWMRRRGVDQQTYDAVKNELLSKNYGHGTTASFENTATAAAAVQPQAPTAPSFPAAVQPQAPTAPSFPAVAQPQAPTAPSFPAVAQPQAQKTMDDLLKTIQQGFGAGKITATYINELVARVNGVLGLSAGSVSDFANNQHAIDKSFEFMNADGIN